jgi:hypothetical protein
LGSRHEPSETTFTRHRARVKAASRPLPII